MQPSPRVKSCLFAAAVLALSASVAVAGTPGPAEPSIDELVAQLQAPEFASRDAATKALIDREDVSLKELEAMMDSPAMSAEQRARLHSIARDRFARTPRAAIGVSFNNGFVRPQPGIANAPQAQGFLVTEVYAGFPAKDKNQLRPNDEIRKVGGFDVDSRVMRSMRPFIISRDPGDVVKMDIFRDGKPIEIDVELGKFSSLPRLQGDLSITADEILDAWRVRAATRTRLAGDAVPVVSVLLPDVEPPLNSALAIESNARVRALHGEWPGVVAGGTPRDSADESGLLGEGLVDAQVANRAPFGPGVGFNARPTLEQLIAQQQAWQARRDSIKTDLLTAQKQREAVRIQSLSAALQQLDRQLAVLRDQISAQQRNAVIRP